MSDLTSSPVLARSLQVKELFAAFVLINLPHATRLTSPSRPTKRLKMAEENNIASSGQPKKSKLPEDVKTPSNLRRSLRRPTHHFDFSNTVDDLIEVEELEDPSESSEEWLAFGEEA